ncbi:Predicted arabinose efflux permease, MFS family [Jatrophihabitans endophyticus]|uniref:Predicted arabinose efflux permease, MFS family n=1 Tax=Jatrophihabitans endophyticus TaxID=1206085 RepID=A0A1M5T566_9ACTN|nr:MFS transporter [Jatrophihabitans endophyticus]SHH45838.1 Predicted arabinose efflux permease, MFS family [Jatrophihabitans endophyticus]
MRFAHRRLAVLLVGSSLGAVGWGAVLPFLYADIADARHLGASVAAVTFTAFALGALVAAPLAGRLADRSRPVRVATVARLGMVLAIVALAYAATALTLWAAAFAYGAALAVVQPSTAVLVLELTPAARRRGAFAWQFIGQNLGLAVGGMVGGYLVDLTVPTGSRPAYAFAAVCSAASAVLVAIAASRTARPALAVDEPAPTTGYRGVLQVPAVRWLLAVTVLLTLACYAQFDSGLPAYALSVLDVAPTTLGTAVAVNTVLVAALTAPVVRLTRTVAPAVLLATCAVLWIGVWVVLAAPMLHLGASGTFVVAGYGLFSVGETMLAPVLTPLAATLAPAGATGRTLAAVTGAQTLATAIGPGLSGLLLGLGLPLGFVALQILCCVLAIGCALRLGRVDAARHQQSLALAA